jgi:hypothetical protein
MKHYIKKGSIAYSPKEVIVLLKKALKSEGGSIEHVLANKHKYKSLIELWHASHLAFAINKGLGKKFLMAVPNQDPPDVFFVDEDAGDAYPVEIMELFDYGQTSFDGDYKRLAKKVADTKGSINMPDCALLLVNKLNSTTFKVSEFVQELKKPIGISKQSGLASMQATCHGHCVFCSHLMKWTPCLTLRFR